MKEIQRDSVRDREPYERADLISCSADHQALRFKVWNCIAPVQKSFAKNRLGIADLKGKQQTQRQNRKNERVEREIEREGVK